MSTISTEQAKDLRNAFECWQEDYDPVEDKEQYDMFGLGVLAMDELLALRKEWERSESIIKAAEKLVRCKGRYHSEQNYRALAALFGVTTPDLPPMEIDTAPPATDKVAKTAFCPKCGNTGLADSGGVQPWGEPILIECDCTFPPAPGADDDSLPFDPQIAEYEQMMEAEQAATDTTSQQFAALAGKAVGGWIPCSERMPDFYYSCLAADEHGDMVIGLPNNLKVSYRKAFRLSGGELFFATHWQPLPEPPCK